MSQLNDANEVASGPGGPLRPAGKHPVIDDVERALRGGGTCTRRDAERSLAGDRALAGLLTDRERAAVLARFTPDIDHLILDATEAAFEHGRQAALYQLAMVRSATADDTALRKAGQRALRAYAEVQLALRRGGASS